jgi:hypothetical protein
VLNSYRRYDFDDHVLDVAAEGSETLLVVHRTYSGDHLASRISVQDTVSGLTTIVDHSWTPEGITAAAGRTVFYGHNPTDGVPGFYELGAQPSEASLLFPVQLPAVEAQGAALSEDGAHLFFASNSDSLRFYQVDLTVEPATRRLLATRFASHGRVATNPTRPSSLLITFTLRAAPNVVPVGQIDHLDLDTLRSHRLNVRTDSRTSFFPLNEGAVWAPNGLDFLFVSSAFSGEGSEVPPTIWVYRDAP